jgi:hypothetical protein
MDIRELNLEDLKRGLPGVTRERCQDFLHALLICLRDQRHQTGVILTVIDADDTRLTFRLRWNDEVTEQMLLTWTDMQEATEEAAYALSFLLILNLTDYTIIGRSAKTTGIDWWLGEKSGEDLLPFDKKARLEVSGILRENSESRIRSRVTQKMNQVQQSDDTELPAYITVIEFSQPVAYVVTK